MSKTLRQILEAHAEGVVIPLLQRDYAQGRPDVRDVRERFVGSLHAALSTKGSTLDLDFVYGTTTPSGPFSPLDGQQRLTTLFLLHWYLAVRDDRLGDFRAFAQSDDASSRFSYRVRPSARDFFDALVAHDLDLDALLEPTPGAADGLSRSIEDQPWFFQSWHLDPTVVSCLVVLDTIHGRFADERGLYARLVAGDPAPITFQFLNLDAFDLTDDLYIKMNARGKPLTAFETFKASFEAHVEDLFPAEVVDFEGATISLQRYVAQRFDTTWCDLFWPLSDASYTHDTLTMNMLRAVALVALERDADADAEGAEALNRTLDALRGARRDEVVPIRTFFDYQDRGLLTPHFIRTLGDLFDRWSALDVTPPQLLGDTAYYDEAAVFRRVARGETDGRDRVTIEEWVQFAGWCDYLLSGQPSDGMSEWMRVVTNLARNTIYNRADELRSSLHSLQNLIAQAESGLIEYLASDSVDVGGFNRQQVREERLKAQLMTRDPRWRPLIEAAETHPYFRGQIEFLLDFSGVLSAWLDAGQRCGWSDAEDEAFRVALQTWTARAEAVFSGDGDEPGVRRLPDHLWERALLCEGDYMLRSGSNWSFLENGGRQTSWKRLLRADRDQSGLSARRALVARVLCVVDPDDVEGSLRARIARGVTPDPDEGFPGWRERLVACPALIGYCKKRQIRCDEGEAIYLLKKQRRSAEHMELFAAYLDIKLRPRVEAGEFEPFDIVECDGHWGATEHWLRLSSSNHDETILIGYWEDGFEVRCHAPWRPERFEVDENGSIWVSVDEVESVLSEIAEAAGS